MVIKQSFAQPFEQAAHLPRCQASDPHAVDNDIGEIAIATSINSTRISRGTILGITISGLQCTLGRHKFSASASGAPFVQESQGASQMRQRNGDGRCSKAKSGMFLHSRNFARMAPQDRLRTCFHGPPVCSIRQLEMERCPPRV